MKVSELIKELQEKQEKYGDIEVYRDDSINCNEEIFGVNVHKYNNKDVNSELYLTIF